MEGRGEWWDQSVMSPFLLCLASLFSSVASQCGSVDNSRCGNYVANGFCNNGAYTLLVRQATCGNACGFCGTLGTTTSCVGTTENANCANWVRNGFCVNPGYTDAMKRQYCCTSCSNLAPTTTCGVIYTANGILINATPSATATTVLPITQTPPPLPLTRVYVRTGCTLNLFTDLLGATAAAGSPIAGTNAFSPLAGTATTSITYRCTCP